jgi:ubiquinone/menaquinone biosynthesis C-methylase UbiE
MKADFTWLGRRYDASRFMPSEIVAAALHAGLAAVGIPVGSTVLECGCGTGQILQALAGHGYRLIGVDPAEPALQAAREKLGAAAALIAGDGRRLPLRDGAVDAVIVAHVLEHVDGWPALIDDCLRVCRPGGVLIFLFSPGFIHNTPRSLTKQKLAERGFRLTRVGARDRAEVGAFLEATGRTVIELTDPAWTWERREPLSENIRRLERREYSVFWPVPDALMEECLAEVKRDLQGREDDVDVITAQLLVWVVRNDGTDPLRVAAGENGHTGRERNGSNGA